MHGGVGRKPTSPAPNPRQRGADPWPGCGPEHEGRRPTPPRPAQGTFCSEACAMGAPRPMGLCCPVQALPGRVLPSEPHVHARTPQAARAAPQPASPRHAGCRVPQGRPRKAGLRQWEERASSPGRMEKPGKHRTCPSQELGPRVQISPVASAPSAQQASALRGPLPAALWSGAGVYPGAAQPLAADELILHPLE